MPEEKRISPAVIVIPLAIGLVAAAVIGIAAMAKAAPTPPEGYVCPYCGSSFSTYEELAAHVQQSHPGERIPLPIIWE